MSAPRGRGWPFPYRALRRRLRRALPPAVDLWLRRGVTLWKAWPFLRRLRRLHPDDWGALWRRDLPERLRLAVLYRLATDKRWHDWPARGSTPVISADVLFVSYRAHPDLVKQCIALKRESPGLRCALAVEQHAHTERLCHKWFDEVVALGRPDPPRLLGLLRNADARVVVLRYRDVLFNTLARLLRRGPLVYSPPGFFLSSRSDDQDAARLPRHVPFLADRFLLENAEGVVHFLSPDAIQWFRDHGVRVSCPTAAVYVACMPELDPPVSLPKLSQADGEWHIVHATGVAPNYGDDPFLSLAKCQAVVSQGVHLHVHATYFDQRHPGYAPYVELERRSPYFHIEDQVEFDDLLTLMTRYDYAWKHWDTSGDRIWPAFSSYLTPNFHAYVQSGLPLLMSPQGPPLEVRMAQEQGIGVFVGEDDLPRLRRTLEENRANLPELQQRVQRAKAGAFAYDACSLMGVVGPHLLGVTS